MTPDKAAPAITLAQRLQLGIAQGFWVGRIPFAPGTFGSLLGLGWFGLLVLGGTWQWLLAGSIAGLALSVWLCGRAERILGQTDPGSVVLDEITAVPVCFLGWAILSVRDLGFLPGPGYFFSARNWPSALAVFVLFRAFDIAKPWPVRQSQRLPGGLGVTVDDLLAALYVNLAFLAGRQLISS